MNKQISVIIVTYNSEFYIYECLSSLFKYNDIGNSLEVIIVDNMSNNVEPMFENIKLKYGDDIILIKNELNGGYGQGNNIGVKRATAPIILIMNPDVRLLHPVFSKSLSFFKIKNSAMLGMMQMRTVDKKGFSFDVKLNAGGLLRIFEAAICNKINLFNSRRMYFAGACFFMRKQDFIEIGMFDEKIFLYGEENDLHHRLQIIKPNSIIFYDNKSRYLHLVNDRSISVKVMKQMLDSDLYFCKKNGISLNICVKRKIRSAQLNRLIAFFKFNKKKVQIYNEWLKLLKQELKEIQS